jgi:HlyD family secretion protein
MTIANMAIVTAEVKVDETDIVNVQNGQPAEVTVDALPGKTFEGHVTTVGDQAILRSTGIATSQSTTGTEQAKDFKVVVTLDHPTDDLRPGLSCEAKIQTAKKKDVLAIPLQALVMRRPGDSVDAKPADAARIAKQQEVQGVFLLHQENRHMKAVFVPVTTGITGTTDIELTGGLKAGDQIITGPYQALRTLKSGSVVKLVDAASASGSNP